MKNLNFYGYDSKTFSDCDDLIRSSNRRHIIINSLWFGFINLLYLVCSFFNLLGVSEERAPFFAAYLMLSLIMTALPVFKAQFVERHMTAAIYIDSAIMLSYGILFSLSQPYMPATLFLILLTLTALSYISTMSWMVIFLVISCALFLASSYLCKTFSIAYHDTYNAIIILVLAIGLHYTFQLIRMQQFVLYHSNRQIQRELQIKSSFDALTSLLNRGSFFATAYKVLADREDEYIALCMMDLDSFKQINDNLGHQMGDRTLQIVANTIIDVLGGDKGERWSLTERIISEKLSIVGRLGGDEFILLLRGFDGQGQVNELLQRILDRLNSVREGGLDGIHASFGATRILQDEKGIDSAYTRADEALYASKRAGKNQIHFIE